jgi:hypothetical protein
MSNPSRELRNLHANGSASLAELREFLAELKGRKPQEVIGIVSASLLAQSMVIAALATVALLAVFTVGPYLIYGPPQAKAATGKKAEAKATAESQSDPRPAAAAAGAGSAATAAAAPSSDAPQNAGPDVERATKAMGLDEARPADPKKNPLDSPNLDKLLDGID